MTKSPVVELEIEPGCSWLAESRWGWLRRSCRPGPRTRWSWSSLEGLQEPWVVVELLVAVDASASVVSKIFWRCCLHWRNDSRRSGDHCLRCPVHFQSPVKMTPIIIGSFSILIFLNMLQNIQWKVRRFLIDWISRIKTINSSINVQMHTWESVDDISEGFSVKESESSGFSSYPLALSSSE